MFTRGYFHDLLMVQSHLKSHISLDWFKGTSTGNLYFLSISQMGVISNDTPIIFVDGSIQLLIILQSKMIYHPNDS